MLLALAAAWSVLVANPQQTLAAEDQAAPRRFLYVAVPGVRNYLEYGGHGLLMFDIDDDYRCVKRIATGGVDETGKPLNVKGVCASADTGRIHISTIRTLMCLDTSPARVARLSESHGRPILFRSNVSSHNG